MGGYPPDEAGTRNTCRGITVGVEVITVLSVWEIVCASNFAGGGGGGGDELCLNFIVVFSVLNRMLYTIVY